MAGLKHYDTPKTGDTFERTVSDTGNIYLSTEYKNKKAKLKVIDIEEK